MRTCGVGVTIDTDVGWQTCAAVYMLWLHAVVQACTTVHVQISNSPKKAFTVWLAQSLQSLVISPEKKYNYFILKLGSFVSTLSEYKPFASAELLEP